MGQAKNRIRDVLASLPAPVLRPTMALLEKLGLSYGALGDFARIGKPDKLLAGPFAGMAYPGHALGSGLLPKLLGVYEMELWPWLDRFRGQRFDALVDIGSAEGYYAAGLTRTLDLAKVVTFDIDPKAEPSLRWLWEKNRITVPLEVHGRADTGTLQQVLAPLQRALVICDIEGFEEDVLVPGKVPALSKAIILVEVHEEIRPGLTKRLRETLSATHTIEERMPDSRDDLSKLPLAPVAKRLEPNRLKESLRERPLTMPWFLCTPR